MKSYTEHLNYQVYQFKNEQLTKALLAASIIGVLLCCVLYRSLPSRQLLVLIICLAVSAFCVFAAFWSTGLACTKWLFTSGNLNIIYVNSLKRPLKIPINQAKFNATLDKCKVLDQHTGKLLGYVEKKRLFNGEWDNLMNFIRSNPDTPL